MFRVDIAEGLEFLALLMYHSPFFFTPFPLLHFFFTSSSHIHFFFALTSASHLTLCTSIEYRPHLLVLLMHLCNPD